METNVKYLLWDEALSWKRLSAYLDCVSEARRRRLEAFVFEKDRVASLLTELLARYEGMHRLNVDNARLRFAYDPSGKPYWEGFAEAHFSVSHTDGCVACANAEAPVGVDAEKRRSVDLQIADRFFDPRETTKIRESGDCRAAFYEIWTKKEAFLKMLGTGMRKPLRSFSVADGGLDVRFETEILPEHTLSVCTAEAVRRVDFCQIEVEQLLAFFDDDRLRIV